MRLNLNKVLQCSFVFIFSSQAYSAEIYNKDGNQLDLYGKVDARHVFSDNASENGDNTYSRLGFKGQTQISDTLTGYGQWEYNFQSNHSEGGSDAQTGNATRLGFVGLNITDVGSFDYGRNFGALYTALSFTDMAPIYGSGTMASNDNFMSKRTTGVASWHSPDWGGLKLTLQYQGKNDRSQAKLANGDGYSAGFTYDIADGLSFAASGMKANRTLLQKADGQGGDVTAWASALKYDANQIYLAAMYGEANRVTAYGQQSRFADKTRNVEVIAQYQFLNGLRPSLGFVMQRGDNLQNTDTASGGNQTLQKYIEIGTYYYFNKNMLTYLDYKINLLNDNAFTKSAALSTKDSIGMGITYQF